MSKYASQDVERLADVFKALSNPNRLKIFLRLAECCPEGGGCSTAEGIGAYVGDLGKSVAVVPSTVSHHVKELQRSGLITCSRRGQNILCCVDGRVLEMLSAFFGEPSGSARPSCC